MSNIFYLLTLQGKLYRIEYEAKATFKFFPQIFLELSGHNDILGHIRYIDRRKAGVFLSDWVQLLREDFNNSRRRSDYKLVKGAYRQI